MKSATEDQGQPPLPPGLTRAWKRHKQVLILVTLAVVVTFQVYALIADSQGRRESGQKLEQISASLQGLVELHRKVDQLETAMRRIEDSGSTDLSREQEVQLQHIETALGNPSRWPKNAKEAEKLREELNGCVESMKPGSQSDQLPRLLSLRWGVEAVWTIRQPEESLSSALGDLAETLSSILEREPTHNRFTLLRTEVEKRQKQAEEAAARLVRVDAVKRAQAVLVENGEPAAALEALVGLQGPDVESLRTKLKASVLKRVTDQKFKLLHNTLTRSLALGGDRLRQAGAARVQDAAIGLLLDLEIEQNRPEDLLKEVHALIDKSERALDDIARHQQDELAVKIRQYQRWALEQSEEFNKWDFDKTLPWVQKELTVIGSLDDNTDWQLLIHCPWSKDVIQEKLGVPMEDVGNRPGRLTRKAIRANLDWVPGVGWKNSIDKELAFRAVRESMITRLLPINTALLDPPVAQLYQKAFTKGWETLEGRRDQLEVAKAAALVPKKPLE